MMLRFLAMLCRCRRVKRACAFAWLAGGIALFSFHFILLDLESIPDPNHAFQTRINPSALSSTSDEPLHRIPDRGKAFIPNHRLHFNLGVISEKSLIPTTNFEMTSESSDTTSGEFWPLQQDPFQSFSEITLRELAHDRYWLLKVRGERKDPGQNGSSFVITNEVASQVQRDLFPLYNMNILVADLIPLDRSVKDLRLPECQRIQYDISQLPSFSLIVIFYNEAPSMILRTLLSVIDRSPEDLLHEIILVDDGSDRKDLKNNLQDYIDRFVPHKVDLIRMPERKGLIGARLVGSDRATSEVLIFLDAHCEVGPGWVEPLLQRIAQDDSVVVLPSHDIISAETFEFYGSHHVANVGTFNWNLLQTWQEVPEQYRPKAPTDTVTSMTMAGGLFAISKRWWNHLGRYDPGFSTWGAENLELSFKTWMCGGRLEVASCAHVGHLFRSPFYAPLESDSFARNVKRLAEVWLDEYKEIVYFQHPKLRSLEVGDLSQRHELRNSLHCHDFRWYLTNVHPEKYIPSLNTLATGGLKVKSDSDMCLDMMDGEKPGFYPCHLGESQLVQLSTNHEIRFGVILCLQLQTVGSSQRVGLKECDGSTSQMWLHTESNKHIALLAESTLCLQYRKETNYQENILIAPCRELDEYQLFEFVSYTV